MFNRVDRAGDVFRGGVFAEAGPVQVLASGVGDVAGPAAADAAITGASIAPPSPVHLSTELLSDGDTRVRWVRRSRIGWTWRDGADAPLGEEREAYRVRIEPAAGIARVLVVTEPQVTVTGAERFGGARVTVRQLGTSAESADATIDLE